MGTYADPGMPGLTFVHLVGLDRYDTSALIAEYAATMGMSYARIGPSSPETISPMRWLPARTWHEMAASSS